MDRGLPKSHQGDKVLKRARYSTMEKSWSLGLVVVLVLASTSSVVSVPLERSELTDPSAVGDNSAPAYSLQSKNPMYLQNLFKPSRDQNLEPQQLNSLFFPENEDESMRSDWETVIDPHLYVLTEWNSNAMQQRARRNAGPSLSIVNPLDVLRQRLLLEIARRRMRQSHNQIMANAEILKNIGKRRRR